MDDINTIVTNLSFQAPYDVDIDNYKAHGGNPHRNVPPVAQEAKQELVMQIHMKAWTDERTASDADNSHHKHQ